MPHIAIISSSVRINRNSHRVALFFQNYLHENNHGTTEIIDLKEFNFPLFDERIKYHPNPSAAMLDISNRVKSADGIIIVTPEYNGGYPAALKNVVDLLYDEWHRKPIALAAVSDGDFGGTQVITSLQFSLWKIRAWVVPARFHVQNVDESYDEKGVPADKAATEKRTKGFISELLWCIEAKSRMHDYMALTDKKK
jgi:NAD(P)H-dependent FMN reductase